MAGMNAPDARERPPSDCPVCDAGPARPFLTVDSLGYWRCPACLATFLDAAHFPDARAERARYLLHNNDPQDPGYRNFLNRLARPLLEKLAPARQGLDYGCGPGAPALAQILAEAGHSIRLYDPFFHPDASALEQTYDFIACTEAVEHFHHPSREFARLDALLRPGGWLGVMTRFLTDDTRFAGWHYRRDETHVVFYRPETFRRIAARFGWQCEIPADNVVLMRKSISSGASEEKHGDARSAPAVRD